jgi:ATP-dependent exoDNAse (exonuclease V) beta subunit
VSEPARALDALARARAQREFDRPLVVEAGAGTGKTAVLTSRLVAWSLGPGWERCAGRLASSDATPDAVAREVLGRIAAITFTEAAAAEMAIRIEQTLRAVETGEPEPSLDEDALPSAEQRAPRARALREALDHLTVRTIHAWCRVVLARFPIAAGLHPEFEVDATGRIQAEALQRVLEQRLREHYADGGPLLDLAELELGPARIEAALNTLIDEGVASRDLDFDPLEPARVAALADELRESFAALAALANADVKLSKVPQEVFPRIRQTLDAVEAHELGDASGLERFCDELRERWEDRSRQLGNWGRGSGTTRLCSALGVDEDEFAAAAARAHAALDVFSRLHPRRLTAAHHAFRTLLRDFERELARRSAVTYADLLRGARDLLVGHPAIARVLRSELDLLLVDEFQDTDVLQCEIVRSLALEGAADERPSLFVVGDPKQSIYGWRNADLAAYDDFLRAIASAGGERLSLSVNFRSVPAVLEEVERVTAPVMEQEDGVQPRFEALHPSQKGSAGSDPTTRSRSGGRSRPRRPSWRRARSQPMPRGCTTRPTSRSRRSHCCCAAAAISSVICERCATLGFPTSSRASAATSRGARWSTPSPGCAACSTRTITSRCLHSSARPRSASPTPR